MIPADWTPHCREDGELVGWIHPAGDAWAAVDLFGRPVAGPVDWVEAEELLEKRGLRWLAEPWVPERTAAPPQQVRVVEVSPGHGRVVVQSDDFGAIDLPVERFTLPWPPPGELRSRRPADPEVSPFG